jgi:hypothetical protein
MTIFSLFLVVPFRHKFLPTFTYSTFHVLILRTNCELFALAESSGLRQTTSLSEGLLHKTLLLHEGERQRVIARAISAFSYKKTFYLLKKVAVNAHVSIAILCASTHLCLQGSRIPPSSQMSPRHPLMDDSTGLDLGRLPCWEEDDAGLDLFCY